MPGWPGGPVSRLGNDRQDGCVARWTCPRCDREFGRARQGHTCVPGCTVDETFAGHSPEQRGVYNAILAHLQSLGPVHEDAVGVGVFLKRDWLAASSLRPISGPQKRS